MRIVPVNNGERTTVAVRSRSCVPEPMLARQVVNRTPELHSPVGGLLHRRRPTIPRMRQLSSPAKATGAVEGLAEISGS